MTTYEKRLQHALFSILCGPSQLGLALLFGIGTKGPSIMGFEDEWT